MVNDRRAGVRLPIQLPVRLRTPGCGAQYQEVRGETADISGNGLLIRVPRTWRQGTKITCSLTLPVEITSVPVELVCWGKVVRRVRLGKAVGIGATIDDYELQVN